MENTNTLDTILWLVAALMMSGMIAVLTKGWLKGQHWQREIKLKKRHSHR